MHRGTWECLEGCNSVFASSLSLRQHLLGAHKDVVCIRRLDDIVNTCHRRVPANFQVQCTLCTKTFTSLTHLNRHVGIHQEELSLFALPKHMIAESDESVAESVDFERSEPISETQVASDEVKLRGNPRTAATEPGEVQDRDLESTLRHTSVPDTKMSLNPVADDVSRIVEAHGGAALLGTLDLWKMLGYDLDLGRDLTDEEVSSTQIY